jgi:hypothetical protein
MRLWVKALKIDLSIYEFNSNTCIDCNRFYKNALKDNSAVFRVLNRAINPIFDWWIGSIVSEEELRKAKLHADAEREKNQKPDGWNMTNNLKNWNRI